MKEQPILGYDWEMGHEEIKLEIGTYYTGKVCILECWQRKMVYGNLLVI